MRRSSGRRPGRPRRAESPSPAGCPVGDVPVRYPVRQLRADLLGIQRRLAAANGGFARYQVLRRVFTLVASAEANRRMFVTEPRNYSRGPQYDNLALLLGRGLITTDGTDWRRQRRLVQPLFDKALLTRVAEITAALTTELVDGWDQVRQRDEQVDLLDDTQELAMRVIGMALFGRDVRGDVFAGRGGPAVAAADCFIEAVRSGFSVAFLRNNSPVPVPLWLPTRLHRRFRAALAAVDGYVYERLDERLADPDGYHDILADLVRAYGDAAHRSRRELRDQTVTLFFAAFETTAIAMAWTWLLLSENPDAEARLHEELDQVLGGRAVPTAADLKALGVAQQVVQESLRMYPPVYTLTRTAAADDEICGHQLRRGDNIVIPVHALQHMEQYWEQPAAFCPERFASGRLTDDQRLTYLPFSYGERRCLGASFATTEIVTMLAVAGQRVRLRRDGRCPVVVVPAVTQRPADGTKMRVEARSAAARPVEAPV
jgi:cytochrome P450